MKQILIILFVLLGFSLQAQVWKGAGLLYTSSAPDFTAPAKGAWVAVDTSSGDWYEWDQDISDWVAMGERLQFTGTYGAPSYTPDQQKSNFAINTGDSLYAYQGGTWGLVAGGGVDLSSYPTRTELGDTASAIRGDFPTVISTLAGLSDVTISSPSSSQVLTYNGTKWANAAPSGLSGGVANYVLQYTSATAADTTGLYWNPTTGRLGIAQTSPAARLHVTGPGSTVSTTALLVENSSGTDALVVTDNTRVGIGLSTPLAGLHLSGVGDIYHVNASSDTRILIGRSVSSSNYVDIAWNNTTSRGELRFSGTKCAEWYLGGSLPIFQVPKHYIVNASSNPNFLLGQTTSSGQYSSVEWDIASQTMRLGTNTGGLTTLVLTESANIGIGTATPSASAKLDITSTNSGFLPPRMTGTQAEAIATPAEGLMIYSTDGSGSTITSKGWWGYDGSTWVKLN